MVRCPYSLGVRIPTAPQHKNDMKLNELNPYSEKTKKLMWKLRESLEEDLRQLNKEITHQGFVKPDGSWDMTVAGAKQALDAIVKLQNQLSDVNWLAFHSSCEIIWAGWQGARTLPASSLS